MYNIIQVSGVQHSDSQFLKVMFHLQLLQNIGYIPCIVLYYPCSLFYTQ